MIKKTLAGMAAVSVLGLALAMGTGCGKKESGSSLKDKIAQKAMEKAMEKQSGGQVKLDSSKREVKIKTKEGAEGTFSESAKGVEVPADFPKDTLIYKGAKATAAVKDKKNYMLMMVSADAMKSVVAAYKADAKKQGWEEETSVEQEKNTMLCFKKKTEKRMLMVSIAAEDGKTRITLNVATEE